MRKVFNLKGIFIQKKITFVSSNSLLVDSVLYLVFAVTLNE